MSGSTRYSMGKPIGPRDLNQPQRKVETTADLRSLLLAQISNVVDGKLDLEQAKAICMLSEQVYKTAKLEIEFAQSDRKAKPMRLIAEEPAEVPAAITNGQ